MAPMTLHGKVALRMLECGKLTERVAAAIAALMERIGRSIGSSEVFTCTFKLYVAEGVVSMAVMIAMFSGPIRYRLVYVVPLCMTCTRSTMIVLAHCFCFGGGNELRIDWHVISSYFISAAMLVLWHAFSMASLMAEGDDPRTMTRVLTAAGSAWLFAANCVVCRISLVEVILILKIQNDQESPAATMPQSLARSGAESVSILQDLTLRVFTITDDDCLLESDPRPPCPICLSAYGDGDLLKELCCGHVFHLQCVDTWLCSGGGRRCPMRCVTPFQAPALEASVASAVPSIIIVSIESPGLEEGCPSSDWMLIFN